MPAKEALLLLNDTLEQQEMEAYKFEFQCWSSSLGLYSSTDGSCIPEPPKPPIRIDDW